MTMKSYLSWPHIMVSVMSGERTMVDEQLVAAGHHRQIGLRVPYFGSAVLAVENTRLIATVPRAAARQYEREVKVALAVPPFKFDPIRILMSWHPSTHNEPGLKWFRAVVKDVGAQLA
jgi:DNA-binding transcriptional LysR family regulator